MNIIEIIAQDVFDKVRSRFTNLEMGDQDGNVTNSPKDARFFDFDFAIEGNNLGRVSISINDVGTLKVYYGQGITEDSDSITKGMWYDFLKEMRFFAKRRMMRFDTRDIMKGNLNKNDFQYLATNGTKENNMNESQYFGSSKTSYRTLENTKLIIRHSKAVNEAPGARSRHIEAMFIENSDGERFKYPVNHLAGAKAMQRHVANGGRPYDDVGGAIVNMSENILQLAGFRRHIARAGFVNESTKDIVEKSLQKLEQLRVECTNLSKQGYYQQWVENFKPAGDISLDEVTIADYKDRFTIKQFEEDLTGIFPLLYSIMQENGEVNLEDIVQEGSDICPECEEDPCSCDDHTAEAFDAFESWADHIAEGTFEPADLKQLLDNGLTLGIDGTSAIAALADIGINDKDLANALRELSKVNPDTEPTETILAWLEKNDPQAAQEIGAGGAPAAAPTPAAPPAAAAPEAPAPAAPAGEPAQQMDMENEEPRREPGVSSKEIAEVVKSFYDSTTGKFPKGETGVVTHIKKQFGDKAGALAERLVSHLTQQTQTQQAFESILKLAGLKESGPDKSQVPAYKRKEKGGDWKMSTKDLDDEKTKSPTSSAGLARKKKELGMSEESHQSKTTMKHVKNPTAGEKKAAKDIKPGIAGYRDRIDMLQSAEKDGRLKK